MALSPVSFATSNSHNDKATAQRCATRCAGILARRTLLPPPCAAFDLGAGLVTRVAAKRVGGFCDMQILAKAGLLQDGSSTRV